MSQKENWSSLTELSRQSLTQNHHHSWLWNCGNYFQRHLISPVLSMGTSTSFLTAPCEEPPDWVKALTEPKALSTFMAKRRLLLTSCCSPQPYSSGARNLEHMKRTVCRLLSGSGILWHVAIVKYHRSQWKWQKCSDWRGSKWGTPILSTGKFARTETGLKKSWLSSTDFERDITCSHLLEVWLGNVYYKPLFL